MTSEDDFQAALDANPDDSQTRLVFADWLDEHEDPRAAGYRAIGQLRLVPAFLPGSDAHVWHWNRRSLLVARRGVLVATWIKELAPDRAGGSATKRGEDWYFSDRKYAEDCLALAWARLSPEWRASIITNCPPR